MTLYPKQERRTKTFRITNDSYSIDSFFFEREERQKSTWRHSSNEEDFNKNLLLGRQIGKTDLSLAFPRPKFGGWVLRSSKTLEASLEEPSKREKENLLSMECKRPCIHPVANLFPSSWAELLDPGSILLPPPWIQLFDSEIIDFRSLAFDGQVSYFIVRGK